ncbi:MAG: DNA-directed RNA polymerase subunit alpha, partial [Planctomycetaceae bacterium]|nr:DNA-directed RNA polymerase subunit alpha [Planctomycetaceae bacterium]
YEQMLAKPPIYSGALINLGLLYEDRELYGPAAFCFRRVLEAQPNNERADLYLKDIESSAEMFYDEDAARRDKQLEQILQIPITDFELSARSRNCLERAGIDQLEDLTVMSEEQLLAGKNFGETSLKEIKAILDMHGLKLGQNVHRKQPEPLYKPEELTPEERALHEATVSELDLSVRARKCLSRLGITTVGELVSRSGDELLSVRNFGVTSLNEIREKLQIKEIKLQGD